MRHNAWLSPAESRNHYVRTSDEDDKQIIGLDCSES